jgi:hypothetical protein
MEQKKMLKATVFNAGVLSALTVTQHSAPSQVQTSNTPATDRARPEFAFRAV